eukprot:scaffold753_cov34-Attheya_sp.AAC.3
MMDDGRAVHDCWDGTTCAVHHYWGCVAADGRHRHSVAALPHFRPTPYIVLHAHIYSRSMQAVHAADNIRFAS